MTVNTWSQTAASNATADSNINWQEGQSPGSVNNSARAMMAALAKFRDDVGCKTATGGTSNVYTLTSNQGFTALADGLIVGFEIDQDCAADPDLNVDSLGARDLIPYTGGTFSAGDLQAGGKYVATYDSSATAWVVHGFFAGLVSTARGGLGVALSDPNADRLIFWDDSAGAHAYLTVSTGLAISETDIALSHLGIESLTDPDADRVLGWDDSAGATAWLTPGDGVEISGTTLQANIADQAEMETGTATDVVVPIGRQHHHPGHPKAWVNYNGTGTPAIRSDYGVSSVADVSTGIQEVTLDTAFSSTDNYTCAVFAEGAASANSVTNSGNTKSTTVRGIRTQAHAASSAVADSQEIGVIFVGDHA